MAQIIDAVSHCHRNTVEGVEYNDDNKKDEVVHEWFYRPKINCMLLDQIARSHSRLQSRGKTGDPAISSPAFQHGSSAISDPAAGGAGWEESVEDVREICRTASSIYSQVCRPSLATPAFHAGRYQIISGLYVDEGEDGSEGEGEGGNLHRIHSQNFETLASTVSVTSYQILKFFPVLTRKSFRL
eukprot:768541-Hanusia_phi.AAC.4